MAFLDQRRAEDELSLWTFGGERVLERFPFGMGWYLLPRVLETINRDTTALYDMVQKVPDVMERATLPRRAVLLLTDGVDNASAMDVAEATRIAEGLQTPVYVLGVEPPPRPPGESGQSFEEILTLMATPRAATADPSDPGHARGGGGAARGALLALHPVLRHLRGRAAQVAVDRGQGRRSRGHDPQGLRRNPALRACIVAESLLTVQASSASPDISPGCVARWRDACQGGDSQGGGAEAYLQYVAGDADREAPPWRADRPPQ